MPNKNIDFTSINRAAVAALPAILRRWLPDGQIEGGEYVALNPTRSDKKRGSFKISVRGGRAGRWSDFATGDRGGDVISLAAYLFQLSQGQAARRLADMLGVRMERKQ